MVKCEHHKEKFYCKECGGLGICKHGIRKYGCVDCGGSSCCIHKKLRAYCEECGGSQICPHKKRKTLCSECRGSGICEHGKRRSICKECLGSQVCEHKRIKTQCKECGGGGICEHGNRRETCKKCGGSVICEHNMIKYNCKQCGGSAICKHGKHKTYCKECGGSSLCKSEWCSSERNKKYDGYCWFCYVNMFPDKPVARKFKTKERAVVDFVKSQFEFEWICDRRVSEGCSLRRPDLLLHLGDQVIVVECDENQHTDYDCSCENKRLMEISQDVDHVPLVFIRFNPDDYMKDGLKTTSCWNDGKIKKSKEKEWKERLEVLKTQIQYWIDNRTPKTVEIVQLFYD